MKLLLATEANEGMGHVAPWTEFVAQALQQGIQVHMAAPDPAQLDRLLGGYLGMNVWQAPTLRFRQPKEAASPKSWPELMISLGYGDSSCLAAAVKAWMNILKILAPDVVLADYAPALILAAKAAGIRLLEVGIGFCVPPLFGDVLGFPGARPNSPFTVKNATSSLLDSFNVAAGAVGWSTSIGSLNELTLWPEKRIVTSPPQLDHYGAREEILYAGFLSGDIRNTRLKPTHFQQPAVIVGYLKMDTPGLDTLMNELQETGVLTYLVIPNCEKKMERKDGAFTVTSTLIDLPSALKHADVYLSNGGFHGIGQALRAGCWPVVVPMQAEQVAMARLLVKNAWGGLWMANLPSSSNQPWNLLNKSETRSNPFKDAVCTAEEKLLSVVLSP